MSNLVLLSGGMDSTLCLAWYGADAALFVDYAQLSLRQEADHAKRIADFYRVPLLCQVVGPLNRSDVIVYARNAVFLSVAAGRAQELGISNVVIGCSASDAARFPDCRPPFIAGMNAALSTAYGVAVYAPLLDMTKDAIVVAARKENIPDTWTCYTPTIDGAECGQCYACMKLKEAKEAA